MNPPPMAAPPPTSLEPLGDGALVLRFGTVADDLLADRIRAAFLCLAAAPPEGLLDLLPTFTTLALFFDPGTTDGDALAAAIAERLADAGSAAAPPPRSFEIPVAYGGDAGPDLAAVAAATGLACDDVVRLHAATTHVVGMIGFAPGFPYLLGLPEVLRLPRRATPRTAVPAGAVAIAEAQTGIYPRTSPGGWHVIGRTGAPLFDPRHDPPALLKAGDLVRFVPIDADDPRARPADSTDEPAAASTDRDTRAAIRVRGPGIATTIEDGGRSGWRAAGVPTGGAADPAALRTANLLVGNADGAAAIEFVFQGPRLEFASGAWVALTGAAFAARVSGVDGTDVTIPVGHPVWIPAGATLAIDTPPAGATGRGPTGIRGCLAISGGFDVPVLLGSRSTCLRAGFGGHAGRALRTGDRLATGPTTLAPPGDAGRVVIARRFVAAVPLDSSAPDARTPADDAAADGGTRLRVVPGPEWERFPPESRERLLTGDYSVGRDSDRTGLRLDGPRLPGPGGILSEALVPGTVQVPPDGAPIVVGVDAPVSGGYPRIAVVASVDLPRLGQLGPGSRVRFVAIDLAKARRLAAARSRELVRRRIGWERVR